MDALFDGLMWQYYLMPYVTLRFLKLVILVCVIGSFIYDNGFMRQKRPPK